MDAGPPRTRSSLRHVGTAAVLASAGMLVSIVLSTLPPESIPLPFGVGHEGGYAGTTGVTDEAEGVFRDADAARTRAERLRTSAPWSPLHSEYAYLNGRILLRVAPYLNQGAADGYVVAIEATALARPTPEPGTRDV